MITADQRLTLLELINDLIDEVSIYKSALEEKKEVMPGDNDSDYSILAMVQDRAAEIVRHIKTCCNEPATDFLDVKFEIVPWITALRSELGKLSRYS